MSEAKTIDIPSEAVPEQTQAIAIRETGGAVGRALTLDQITERLAFIRQVMKDVMKEGQDYGKIPGTGDRPSLLQPGAQKLLMTFNLREQLKKETLREYPGMHREYELTVTVFPSGSRPEDGWDGVGTCSTLESKYRYRKAERRCPTCGKNAIIQGKAEYGGGWVCFKKKGGCGAKFAENASAITEQPGGTVENEDPADQWNTVRKMAFKRALVAAAINATNTSELWTQDLEDMAGNAAAKGQNAPGTTATGRAPTTRPAPESHTAPSQGNATAPKTNGGAKNGFPTAKTRDWMFLELEKTMRIEFLLSFFADAGIIMPNETISDFPLRWVANTRDSLGKLKEAIVRWGEGGQAQMPYGAHEEPLPEKKAKAKAKPKTTGVEKAVQDAKKDPEWWRGIVVPVPRKGQNRNEYLKTPDTIGSLYDQVHDQTADGQDARQRLYGFLHHFEAKGWTKRNGEQMPPSEADILFREALDAFGEWHEKMHPEEKL